MAGVSPLYKDGHIFPGPKALLNPCSRLSVRKSPVTALYTSAILSSLLSASAMLLFIFCSAACAIIRNYFICFFFFYRARPTHGHSLELDCTGTWLRPVFSYIRSRGSPAPSRVEPSSVRPLATYVPCLCLPPGPVFFRAFASPTTRAVAVFVRPVAPSSCPPRLRICAKSHERRVMRCRRYAIHLIPYTLPLARRYRHSRVVVVDTIRLSFFAL